ncbi:MAG: chromosomal replication initiator protein DnaA [Pseudomonadota bacterium]|nr:chromosomal replication initiator protein DnaA [Pseudomonadota bacterium]MEC8019856.1 chromosomal replication initiator protein DnaA [Pseudomonadota bacterium]
MSEKNSKTVDIKSSWDRTLSVLRAELGEATFRSWFKHIEFGELIEKKLVLYVPTKFMKDWIHTHYSDRILTILKNDNISVSSIFFELQKFKTTKEPLNNNLEKTTTSSKPSIHTKYSSDESGDHNSMLGAPLDPNLSFDNFVVGGSNELAYAAAKRITEVERVSFNPLFLYGGVGLGKTHLMHAMALEIKKNWPERKVLYLSAEKFMYQFIKALRFKDTMSFKQQFRSVDVLMVDDIQFIAGKDSTQEEFFHTFNTLIDHNHQVVISADRSPVDLDGIEERIRSRLGWGLVTDIHASDYELRLGVLQTKAKKHVEDNPEIIIKDNILEFLAQRIDSNIRVLEGALNRVIAYSSFVNKPLTIEMAQEVLKDLIRASQRKITIDDIQRKVADYYNIRLSDLLSARRSRTIARPRQVAMYLSKILTTRSLPEIGRKFGGRDHTTVIHAVKRIESLQDSDNAIQEEVEVLSRALEN